jgi:hypothetical protein
VSVTFLRGMVHTCPQCAQQAPSWMDFCPSCEARISNPGRIRVLGWILIVIGTGLVVGMGYLIAVIYRIVQGSNDPAATTRFTGTPAQALMIYAVLGVVLLFGMVAVAGGAWQARYGTRNPHLVKMVLGFATLFITAGVLFRLLT